MVRFVDRRRPEHRHLTVRLLRSRNGYRLVVSHPGGVQRLHTFPDHAALVAGTAALQAALVREGWEPRQRPTPRWRPAVANSRHPPREATDP